MEKVEFINRDNLKIARENSGLDTKGATKKISSSKEDIVLSWEKGESLPTWKQAEKLAVEYNISVLLFFSDKPIERHKIIPDYRSGLEGVDDTNVKKLLNVVVTRQKWLEKVAIESSRKKNELQGSGKNIVTPADLAVHIMKSLEIKPDDLRSISGYGKKKKVLDFLISKAEQKGIFVGKTISHHKIEVKQMRGLYISNDYAPFIVINRKDALSAQIFTFVHELSHFYRRSDAISNVLDFRNVEKNIDPEEVFCNRVAAEFLLPRNDFTKTVNSKDQINTIADYYCVSPLFVFYRLKDLGLIQKSILVELEAEIVKETSDNVDRNNKKKSKGGNHVNNMKDSNGSLFNKFISNIYLESKIGYVEASRLLRFSVEEV
jgi:Zn-dependent peptidase ImmA (M78 family)/DNA-binding XRE family transcriptional regulator